MGVCVCVCAHVVFIYIYMYYNIYICTVAYVYYSYDSDIYIYCLGNFVTPTQRQTTLQHPSFSGHPPLEVSTPQPKFDPWDWYVCLTRYSEFCSKILQQKKGHASHVASSGFHISPGDRILVSQLISPLVYPFTPFDLIGQYSRGIWYVAWQKWSIQNPATTFFIFDN